MPGFLDDIQRRQRWLAQELPRLREQIKREVRAEMEIDHGLGATIDAAFAEPYARTEGKTLGLKIPDDLRHRLVVASYGREESFTHLVMVAIRIGAFALEQTPMTADSEEARDADAASRPDMLPELSRSGEPTRRMRAPRVLEPVPEPVHDEASDVTAEAATSDPDFD